MHKYLNLFDLDPNFDRKQLKKSYNRLAQVWHPDKHQNNPRLAKYSLAKIKEINIGYEVLSRYLENKEAYNNHTHQNNKPNNTEDHQEDMQRSSNDDAESSSTYRSNKTDDDINTQPTETRSNFEYSNGGWGCLIGIILFFGGQTAFASYVFGWPVSGFIGFLFLNAMFTAFPQPYRAFGHIFCFIMLFAAITTVRTPSDDHIVLLANQLNWELEPLHGVNELRSPFYPDPITIEMKSGGEVNVENLNLGIGCIGFATEAPDYRIHKSGENRPLNLTFLASNMEDNSTLIINAPDGSWHCNESAHGNTHNPRIDFRHSLEGQYDIWVGSYTKGKIIEGMLRISELNQTVP